VVATPALKRMAWLAAVGLSAVVLTVLALVGTRPDSALVPFQAAGVMLAIAPDAPTEVRVDTEGSAWRFTRGADGAWSGPAPTVARVAEGLRLLHGAAPHRIMTPDELGGADLAEFGLDPPRYVVSVELPGRAPFVVRFGRASAHGAAQYVQVAGRGDIILLPRYVGEAWEAATGMP